MESSEDELCDSNSDDHMMQARSCNDSVSDDKPDASVKAGLLHMMQPPS